LRATTNKAGEASVHSRVSMTGIRDINL